MSEPKPNPDLSARYPTASARQPAVDLAAVEKMPGESLQAYFKNPRTIVLFLVAEALVLLLGNFAPWWALIPMAAMVALGFAIKQKWMLPVALGLLVCGGVALFFSAGLKVFIAFAYPAVFASLLVTTDLRRMMVTLFTLVAIFGASTLMLDMGQQELSYGRDKKVIVLASMWASGESKQPIYDKLIAEFEKENPQYKVVVRYDGRWVLSKNRPRLLTHKDVPDLIEGGKEELRILAQENYAVPLDEILEKNSPYTGKPWKEDWIPAVEKLGRYNLTPRQNTGELRNPSDGQRLMASGIMYHSLFFYNKALIRRLGVTRMPETWDEFKALCDKARDQNITPIMLDSAYQDMIADVLLVNSLPENELRKTVTGAADGKPFTDPQYVRIFALERVLADKYFQPQWQASKWPAAQQDFATGKGMFVLCGSWLPAELRKVAVQDKDVFDLSAMPIPRFDDQPAGTFNIEVSGWMLLKDGNERAGAIKLLQFFSDRWGRKIAVEDGNPVSFARDPLPADFKDIEKNIQTMKRAANEPVAEYGAKWKTYIYAQLHRDFFQAVPGDPTYITPEAFAAELQKRTEEYRTRGGEAYYQ